MTLYQVIIKIDKLNSFLKEFEKKLKEQNGKIFLIKSLKSLLSYSVNILKDFRESEKIEGEFLLTSLKYQNKTIRFSLQREFVEKTLRKTLIFVAWCFFENFFQKETKTKKIGYALLKEYFGGEDKIPSTINFFRGLRNSMHGNAIYHGEKLICQISGHNYELKDNEPVIVEYSLILDIIEESLNLLEN